MLKAAMELHFETITLLLLIAAVVAMLTRRLRLPYSVGLVAAGIALTFLPHAPHLELTHDLLFTALLPPLLFEAALDLDWPRLRRNAPVILTLVTVGVVIAAALTASGVHGLLGWPWASAILFGVLIAATDPVSVVATFKEAKATGRLPLLIESESLLNDGTAAVLFTVALTFAAGQAMTPWGATVLLVKAVGGGLLCGVVVGLGALALVGRTEDHLVEITLTTIAAYGSFFLADALGVSGVLATIAAGLTVGNVQALGVISPKGREAVEAFWEYAAFLSNSLIFLLIGMHEAERNFGAAWGAAVVGILLVTVSRAATVYPCCLLFAGSHWRVSLKHQHALVWGGLRGALALALALSLPEDLPCREPIITLSFAVVAFSVFVQGLTMRPLLGRIGELPGPEPTQK
jgi:CPA1 family monovalent cation:H+ antiporter